MGAVVVVFTFVEVEGNMDIRVSGAVTAAKLIFNFFLFPSLPLYVLLNGSATTFSNDLFWSLLNGPKGAHTIGVAHCGAFSRRLNFTGKGDNDQSLDPTYVETLKEQCSNQANPATTVEMDPRSSLSFDTRYFATVNQNKGLFQSDAALLMNPISAGIVKQLEGPWAFFDQFGKSMVKMGAIEVLVGNVGEIRKNCRIIINP
ncbi:unnamed protein product [Fraxinus pennsylvanica]|uniref:peroxidase n=1 Tax=Fraxinus pennsylvanica TaxID=56036 RepID=A0AAD1ZPU0_9LAMI|nr:unnamed protein product [Fraxinus pennsylvanica]